MVYSIIGLILVTACLSAQQGKESNPPYSIYANGFRDIEKDQHVAQMVSQSGIHLVIGQNERGSFGYNESQIRAHLQTLNIELSYNEIVGSYVQFYLNSDPERLKLLFGLNRYYASSVSSNLGKLSLPQVLELIPAVCSSYGPTSTNDHGGAGPWHLNYPQAIRYGLRIDKNVDERREMEKATVAATAYLSDLYKLYGNWELTLAAYTCGPANINKELSRQKASTFWEIYPYLPQETRDIVPALAALTYVREHQGSASLFRSQLTTDTVRIHKKLLYKALKDVVNGDLKELNFLNPALLAKEFPSNYTAVFSIELKEHFTRMKDSVYYYQDSVLLYPKPVVPKPEAGINITHTVRSGEVLGSIAEKYKVRVSQIQYWNNMGRSTRINIGQKLVIYDKEKPVKTAAVDVQEGPKNLYNKEYITYVVRDGECLDGIAKKYPGISARNIMELNNIDDNIQAELILKIKKR